MSNSSSKLGAAVKGAGQMAARAFAHPVGEGIILAGLGGFAGHGLGTAAKNVLGDQTSPEDIAYWKRVHRAMVMIGAAAGALNPVVRYLTQGNMVQRTAAADFYSPSPFFPSVNKDTAFGVVNSDPFLTSFEKTGVTGLISRAQELKPHETSTHGLVKSALRAGVSFVPAYAFGTLMGKALGVPSSTAKLISRTGALAYAVRASGLMEELK